MVYSMYTLIVTETNPPNDSQQLTSTVALGSSEMETRHIQNVLRPLRFDQLRTLQKRRIQLNSLTDYSRLIVTFKCGEFSDGEGYRESVFK